MTPATVYDVLIIGAGPAGLSTALGLARQTYSAIVFNSNQYRNAFAERMHNVVTWDHKPPSEFRAAARENIESRYNTIQFKTATIVSAAKKDDGTFEVIDEQENKYQGRKIALATGVTDVVPDIKGFRELWGKMMYVPNICFE
jgi:thioredoxin reductase